MSSSCSAPVRRLPLPFSPMLPLPKGMCIQSRPTFGAGDVVGCGIMAIGSEGCVGLRDTNGGIFFSLNGIFLGVVFIVSCRPKPFLWPCVGFDGCLPLSFNFGDRPFALDLDALLKTLPLDRHAKCLTSARHREALRIETSSSESSMSSSAPSSNPGSPHSSV
eukprot:NODE_21322_length_759_cov_4.742089.p3 GENE.NODE_21322_length_759_cov_4.742089~~NODE_21322_length_759_cov_4.742089.p3  ORF type:complete len:163 (+),score=30.05 NODE_21322_length_759_cov_4.742089:226-714(+)